MASKMAKASTLTLDANLFAPFSPTGNKALKLTPESMHTPSGSSIRSGLVPETPMSRSRSQVRFFARRQGSFRTVKASTISLLASMRNDNFEHYTPNTKRAPADHVLTLRLRIKKEEFVDIPLKVALLLAADQGNLLQLSSEKAVQQGLVVVELQGVAESSVRRILHFLEFGSFPPHLTLNDLNELERDARILRFPTIVKTVVEFRKLPVYNGFDLLSVTKAKACPRCTRGKKYYPCLCGKQQQNALAARANMLKKKSMPAVDQPPHTARPSSARRWADEDQEERVREGVFLDDIGKTWETRDEACAKYGLFAGQEIMSPMGFRGTVVGVRRKEGLDFSSERIWVKWSGGGIGPLEPTSAKGIADAGYFVVPEPATHDDDSGDEIVTEKRAQSPTAVPLRVERPVSAMTRARATVPSSEGLVHSDTWDEASFILSSASGRALQTGPLPSKLKLAPRGTPNSLSNVFLDIAENGGADASARPKSGRKLKSLKESGSVGMQTDPDQGQQGAGTDSALANTRKKNPPRLLTPEQRREVGSNRLISIHLRPWTPASKVSFDTSLLETLNPLDERHDENLDSLVEGEEEEEDVEREVASNSLPHDSDILATGGRDTLVDRYYNFAEKVEVSTRPDGERQFAELDSAVSVLITATGGSDRDDSSLPDTSENQLPTVKNAMAVENVSSTVGEASEEKILHSEPIEIEKAVVVETDVAILSARRVDVGVGGDDNDSGLPRGTKLQQYASGLSEITVPHSTRSLPRKRPNLLENSSVTESETDRESREAGNNADLEDRDDAANSETEGSYFESENDGILIDDGAEDKWDKEVNKIIEEHHSGGVGQLQNDRDNLSPEMSRIPAADSPLNVHPNQDAEKERARSVSDASGRKPAISFSMPGYEKQVPEMGRSAFDVKWQNRKRVQGRPASAIGVIRRAAPGPAQFVYSQEAWNSCFSNLSGPETGDTQPSRGSTRPATSVPRVLKEKGHQQQHQYPQPRVPLNLKGQVVQFGDLRFDPHNPIWTSIAPVTPGPGLYFYSTEAWEKSLAAEELEEREIPDVIQYPQSTRKKINFGVPTGSPSISLGVDVLINDARILMHQRSDSPGEALLEPDSPLPPPEIDGPHPGRVPSPTRRSPTPPPERRDRSPQSEGAATVMSEMTRELLSDTSGRKRLVVFTSSKEAWKRRIRPSTAGSGTIPSAHGPSLSSASPLGHRGRVDLLKKQLLSPVSMSLLPIQSQSTHVPLQTKRDSLAAAERFRRPRTASPTPYRTKPAGASPLPSNKSLDVRVPTANRMQSGGDDSPIARSPVKSQQHQLYLN